MKVYLLFYDDGTTPFEPVLVYATREIAEEARRTQYPNEELVTKVRPVIGS